MPDAVVALDGGVIASVEAATGTAPVGGPQDADRTRN